MKLTEGTTRQAFFQLWLPMIGGVLAVKAIGVSDAYFVGQLGADALAAISFTFPIVMTLISLSIGLSAGASSVLSRAIGNDESRATQAEIVTGAIALAIGLSLVLSVLGFTLIPLLLKLMGATGQQLDDAVLYMQIWSGGVVFLVLPIAINGMLRATGDGISPALLMTTVAVINIAINPVFIFGLGPVPEFGMQGAAVATISARAVGMLASLWLIWNRNLLSLKLDAIKAGLARWREVARIGLPASLSTSLNPMAITVITSAIAAIGSSEVAAYGLATKIQGFIVVPLLALSSATAPFVGQNSGAGEIKRSRESLYLCAIISLAWAVILAIFFLAFGKLLIGLFVDDEAVKDAASLYLMIVPLSYAGYGLVIALSSALNGLGRSGQAMGVSGGRAAIFLAPLAAGGAYLFGFIGVAIGTAAANLVSGLAALGIVKVHPLTERDDGDACNLDESECA